jgi:hypothetical protein
MAPTVAEILKQSGMSDAEIAALDARVLTAATTVISTAAQLEAQAKIDRDAAELADRNQRALYSEKIAPALNEWGADKANLEAERDFYRTQAQSAKTNGFIAKDAPGYVAPANGDANRGSDGKYVPNAGGVPGSPAFMTRAEGLSAVNLATWAVTEHQRLHGAPLPDDVETLDREATAQRMPFRDYVSKKYGFDAKKQEIATARENAKIESVVAERLKENDRKWAEKVGSNPNVAAGTPSQFTQLKAGVDSKQIKDPLMMNKQERHAQTSQLINREIADNAAAVH